MPKLKLNIYFSDFYNVDPDEIINFDLGNTFDFSKYLSIIGTTLVSNSIKMRISEEPYLEEFIDNLDFIVKNPNVKKVAGMRSRRA